jgi:hypothetical protein
MTTTLLGELEELVRAVEGEEASEQFREFVLEPPMRVERSAPEAGEVLVNLDFGVGETRYTRTGNYPQNEGSLPSACAEFNQRFRASGRPWIAWPRIGTETGADIEVVTKERGLSGPTVGVQHTCALLPDAGHDASKGKLKRTVRQPDFFTAIRDALNKKEHKASRDLVLAIDLVDLQIAGTLSGLEMMEEVQELAQKSKWGAIVLCGSGMPGFAVSWVIHPVAEGERAPLPCDGFPLFDGLIEPGAGSE